MYDTETLVKKFDNVFPVRAVRIRYRTADGEYKETIDYVPDYETAEKIRAKMTQAEKERQRTIR